MKNTLGIIHALLSLELDKIQDGQARSIFLDSIARIQSISQVYQQLYDTSGLHNIDLKHYIEEMSHQLLHTYQQKPGTLRLSLKLDEVTLDMKRAMNIGIILNELLINVIKYAFPSGNGGEISIVLNRKDKDINLTVSDDGRGLGADFHDNKGKGMGLNLVDSLARKMDGVFALESQKGTTARLIIPL